MPEWVKTALIVTVLTILVWLFAENESLTEQTLSVRLDVTASESEAELTGVRVDDFDGRASLDVRGSRNAIEKLRQELDVPVRLVWGQEPMPGAAGSFEIDLLDTLRRVRHLRETGAAIEGVRPRRLSVTVTSFKVVSGMIEADLPASASAGDPTLEPASARVRVPASTPEEILADLRVPAVLPPGAAVGPGSLGGRTVPLELQVPASLRSIDGVRLLTRRTRATFPAGTSIATAELSAVPVQLVVPHYEAEAYAIDLHPEDQILSATVTGPASLIDAMRRREATLIGLLSLTDVELASPPESKAIAFGILRAGAVTPAPESLRIEPSKPAVRFTARVRSQP